jgi:hypothetical protein
MMLKDFIEFIQNDYYAPISFDLGFNIKKIISKLPESHKLWDDQAIKIADNMATFQIKSILEKMPVLHADETNLPDEYLLRASIVISGFAHAFYYPDGYSDKYPLPNSVLIPLQEISHRINKKLSNDKTKNENSQLYIGRTYLEDFLGNWQFNSNRSETITPSFRKVVASELN